MKKQTDIIFLASVLVLLSASIGILHGIKKGVDPEKVTGDVQILVDQQQAIDYLQPYLMSDNIDLAATTLHQFADPLFTKTLDILLENKTLTLSDEQKVALLTALLVYDKNENHKKMILERLRNSFGDYPIFVPMIPLYAGAIPIVTSWIGQLSKEQLIRWVTRSIETAIKKDDVELLMTLYKAGMPTDGIVTGPLLYQVVVSDKNPAFIQFFMDQLKADIYYTPDGKRTLLIIAVGNGNINMVKALLAYGADPDQVLDSQIGSARQVAFEKNYPSIELILKKLR